MALDLVISGATGRMGQALARLIQEAEDLRTLGGIAGHVPDDPTADGYPEIVRAPEAGELVRRAEAVIDFSAPEQLKALLDHCGDDLARQPLLVGTTGLEPGTTERLRELAERTPVLVAANFSVGVNVLLGLVEQAARALPEGHYDIEIVETHHRRKEDAPSGTAIALGEAAARGRDISLETQRRDGRGGRVGARPSDEIGFHAVRGGDVAGEHIVHLIGDRERIALAHHAMSRDLFAEGALKATRWIVEREAGWYTMQDVLGLHPEAHA